MLCSFTREFGSLDGLDPQLDLVDGTAIGYRNFLHQMCSYLHYRYISLLISENKAFDSLHFWVLLPLKKNDLQLGSKKIYNLLASLYIPINSHVTVAETGKANHEILLKDVCKFGPEQKLTMTSSAHQKNAARLKRNNYGGISIKSAALVFEGTWDTFLDITYRHQNTESKFHFVLMSYISEMLNFTFTYYLHTKYTWGYPSNGSDCFNGIIGTLQENCGDCEISTTGLMWKTERMERVDYVTDTNKFLGAFVFLKPSLSEVSIIYELPFSLTVWITFSVTMAILTIILVFVRQTENHLQSKNEISEPVFWSDAILDTIGIICQQVPENIINRHTAARIIFMFLLLLSVFLVTSYSAIIVSLLQTTSSSINSLEDLINSPLRLSIVDVLANEVTDPTVEKLFKEKLYNQPVSEAFTSEEVGMEKIRKGLFAFHGLFGANKIISDTYEEHEKCRFKQIPMFMANHIGFPIKKGSPYTEHIRQSVQWLRETGIMDREVKRWYYQKPQCISGVQNFVSVGIQDFYPTMVILSYGILFSIAMLVLETIYCKYHNRITISK
ncbi:hypothetical protein L9F63_002298 [Diploptera punctata]|uniref:Ionotropic glutamate receptor C-terminal domain-containing protein n=1 Tax=Diploptera punctata TaxID=6984 RepID=A0AAD8A474_DIPPU|nr:hypothetical protein L9F63_002298 [Diploptera punctata]